ncbi:MAG: hypothetical protein PQJ50_12740 [Spirochaetales bacterium]|nr:hypothetical protein [Spirochaetales bacterium]
MESNNNIKEYKEFLSEFTGISTDKFGDEAKLFELLEAAGSGDIWEGRVLYRDLMFKMEAVYGVELEDYDLWYEKSISDWADLLERSSQASRVAAGISA